MNLLSKIAGCNSTLIIRVMLICIFISSLQKMIVWMRLISRFIFLPLVFRSQVNSCVTQRAQVHLLWMNSLRVRWETQRDYFRRATVSPHISCPRRSSWLMNDLTFAPPIFSWGAHRRASHSHLVRTGPHLGFPFHYCFSFSPALFRLPDRSKASRAHFSGKTSFSRWAQPFLVEWSEWMKARLGGIVQAAG